VCLNENNELEWPLLLQYPQVGQADTMFDCSENSRLEDLLMEVLSSPAPWDTTHQFRHGNVRFFIALDDGNEGHVQEVLPTHTLGSILSTKDFAIVKGLPVIQVTKRHTKYPKRIFQLYTRNGIEGKLKKIGGDKYCLQ
jgi:hypothetical protein